MINLILGYIDDLRSHTELLEALNWDDELTAEFTDELRTMLLAARYRKMCAVTAVAGRA